METIVEKFDPFDLFTNLIPGVILTTLFSTSVYLSCGETLTSLGAEVYFVFFVVSYLAGLMFKELSSLCNSLFLWKLLYGGRPREIYLTEQKHRKIFDTEAEYLEAKKAETFVTERLGIQPQDREDTKSFRTYSNMIFAYCLNILEANGLAKKGKIMQRSAEMSTSVSLGCFLLLILNGYLMCRYQVNLDIFAAQSAAVLASALLLLLRKKRLERYNVQIIIRYFNLYISGLAGKQD